MNTDNYFTSPTMADLYGPSTALFQPGVLNGDLNPQLQLRPSSPIAVTSSNLRRTSASHGIQISRTDFSASFQEETIS